MIDEPSGPPEELVCPFTLELMVDPVMLVGSGWTYERAPLERWLATHDTDPMTNVLLTDKTVRENVLVRFLWINLAGVPPTSSWALHVAVT